MSLSRHGSSVALAAVCALVVGCGDGDAGLGAPLVAFADQGVDGLAPVPEPAEPLDVDGFVPPEGGADASATAAAPASDSTRVRDALERLGAHALVDLARRLETGAPLSPTELACLDAYDPSVGEPLAALACDAPLPVAGTPVHVRALEMRPDETCLAALGDSARVPAALVAGCDWRSASMVLATEWVAAPATEARRPERPRPLTGAAFDYAAEPPTLAATHLDSRLTGRFTCTASLATGALDGGTLGGDDVLDCFAQMASFADRLEAYADARDADAPGAGAEP